MAKVELRLTLNFRWWVRPYLALLTFFLPLLAPFGTEDQLAGFIEGQAKWIADRGMVVTADPS